MAGMDNMMQDDSGPQHPMPPAVGMGMNMGMQMNRDMHVDMGLHVAGFPAAIPVAASYPGCAQGMY